MATIFVDADEWDARADALGGTSNALLAGLAARLAQRAGRVGADGFAILALPVNERTAGDTRANAITAVDITVDPATVPTDLRAIRAALKHELIRRQEVPDQRWALLPLSPLPAANRPDGTDADQFAMRTLYPGVTKATMHHTGGLLGLLSGRVHGQVFVSVYAYQPGRPNSDDDLRRDLASALRDFSLTATTGWGCPRIVGTAR
jgi:hypothetical protein